MFRRRVTVFTGHFGSGKTEIAVNHALALAAGGTAVALADLDVVKPYFRSRSARQFLEAAGVHLVVPPGEHFHADLPIIVPQVRSALRDGRRLLLDCGGDDTGARVLGSLADVVRPDEIDHLLVLNFRRPFTETVEDALVMAREIQATARLQITGVISNTHLMDETTSEIVLEGARLAAETARRLSLPVAALGVEEKLRPALDGLVDAPLLTLKRLLRPPFEPRGPGARVGPVFVLN